MEAEPPPLIGHMTQVTPTCRCAHHDVAFALVQAVVSQLLVGAAAVEDAGAGQVHQVVHCGHKER